MHRPAAPAIATCACAVAACAIAACTEETFGDPNAGARGAGAGADGGSCVEGAVACTASGDFDRCVQGRWVAGVCEGGCQGGHCGESQCPDATVTQCDAEGGLRLCDPEVGGFEARGCPSGEICVDGGCRGRLCEPERRFCMGDVVHVCDATGTASAPVETCEACNEGLCLTPCQAAEIELSFVGCLYYAIDADNTWVNELFGRPADDLLQYDIAVANPSSTEPAGVQIEERVAGGWQAITTVTVGPLDTEIIPVTCTGPAGCRPGNLRPDRHIEDSGRADGAALRVRSDRPITAWQFNSDDFMGMASSSGATILFPRPTLDTRYTALTARQIGNERAWVAIVGTEPDTTVSVRVSDATVGGPGVEPHAPGESFVATLGDGDVLQVASAAPGGDLSGSTVEADKPVAVFAGNECARVEAEDMPGAACGPWGNEGDHTEEQMLPLTGWGREFVAAHVRHPDQVFRERATFKLVASEDGTVVSFEPGPDAGGLPGELRLAAGGVEQWTSSGAAGHFVIRASEPVQVMQIVRGEDAAILVVPVEQYLPEYVFLAPPFFDDTLTVAEPVGAQVRLDGAALIGQWNPAGARFEAAWVDSLADDAHHLSIVGAPKGQAPGVQVVGMDENCSYGYLGGLNVERINPIE